MSICGGISAFHLTREVIVKSFHPVFSPHWRVKCQRYNPLHFDLIQLRKLSLRSVFKYPDFLQLIKTAAVFPCRIKTTFMLSFSRSEVLIGRVSIACRKRFSNNCISLDSVSQKRERLSEVSVLRKNTFQLEGGWNCYLDFPSVHSSGASHQDGSTPAIARARDHSGEDWNKIIFWTVVRCATKKPF